MPDAYDFDLTSTDGWIGVSGGNLPFPLRVKVRWVRGGLVVTGLHMETARSISSTDLREIRIASLVSHLGPFLAWHTDWLSSEAQVADSETRAAIGEGSTGGNARDAELEEWTVRAAVEEAQVVLNEWRDRMALLDADDDLELRQRGRGARPATDSELRAFARAYLDQVVLGVRGAKSRTAKQLGMDRSTVYRWIALCEKRGYLPKRSKQ